LGEKRFLPLGSDREATSEFQLIAGTNRDLARAVHHGRFREDLLARMNLWTFFLPGLAQRPEDMEPNLDFELEQFARRGSLRATMSKEVRERFLSFARSPAAHWKANFRDLNACVTRMATLSTGGRITRDILDLELDRLRSTWATVEEKHRQEILYSVLSPQELERLDLFDRVQLEEVIGVCRESGTLSEAGRKLFSATREKRKVPNDADRLRKYLARFGLDWQSCNRSDIQSKPSTNP
jgi:transcriptional regulatory protein RtcR